MKGANIDSHQYIPDVMEKGCTSIVVEDEASALPVDISEINEDITIVKVANAREALAHLSAARFGYPSKELTVIGIT